MSTGLFGWELLYGSVERDIRNNEDILVCLAHLVLVSNGFRCIGLGESKIIDGSESKSEALPRGWNEHYAIRYVYQGRLYNFRATPLDDGVMLNLIRVDERSVSLVQLNSRSVASRTGTLDDMIPDNKNIIDMIKKQLIEKVVTSKKSKDMSCQTETQSSTSTQSASRLLEDRVTPAARFNPYRPGISGTEPGGRFDPAGVGRNDLDPFAGIDPLRVGPRIITPGGGGMLFQPPGPSFGGGGHRGLPPGAVPPGARFDPFRPPDAPDRSIPRPPNRPDNDEFPPPGYDDMFM
nr:unnamed protein product [Callosobruchus analis]